MCTTRWRLMSEAGASLKAAGRVMALMPAWNSAPFIERTLESLAAQTYQNFSVLISDDASSDSTGEVCKRFAGAHSNFTYVHQPRRSGWIGNVNALLALADADYLFFAFHDDPLEPTYVSELASALDRNPHASLAFTDVLVDRESLPTEVKRFTELDSLRTRLERAMCFVERRGLWWIPNRGLFRADAARKVGGLRHHRAGEYSADLPWLLHLALLGEFVRVPQTLIRKTWRKAGLSMTWKGTRWQSFALALACADEIDRAGVPANERSQLRRALAVRELKSAWWQLLGR